MKVQGRALERHPSSRQVMGRISELLGNPMHTSLSRAQQKPARAELCYMWTCKFWSPTAVSPPPCATLQTCSLFWWLSLPSASGG